MIIRPEEEKDFDEVYRLVQTAFKTAQVADGNEQDFVVQLRKSPGYISELALIAEDNGELIGQVMLTRFDIEGHEVLLLAPLCVALDYRSKGLGGQLIKEAFERARDMGFTAVILVGNPDYYSRFGFKPSIDFNIKNTDKIPDKFVQVCELVPHALDDVAGTVTFHMEK